MAADASIYGLIQQPKAPNPLEALAGALKVQALQQEGDLNRLKADDYRLKSARTNKLQQLASTWGADTTDDQRISGLKNNGYFDEADKLEQGLLKRRETETKVATEQQAIKGKQFEFMANVLRDVKDQAGYDKAYQLAGLFGMDLKNVPTAYDPTFVQQVGQAFTTQAQQWAHQQAVQSDETSRRGQDITAATARRGQDITAATARRGQDLTDARSRDANELKRQEQANGKPLTDAQAKANLFGTRMQESNRILTGLEGKYWPGAVNAKMNAGDVPIVGGTAGYIGNLMLTEEGQQAEQAQRDFVNAVLRRESGAVISPSEFANAQKQYFPQPGDDPKTLAQKRANRQLAISGLQVEVPGGFRGAPTLTNAKGAGVPDDIAAILKKHGGK